jgi:hypothetical protein
MVSLRDIEAVHEDEIINMSNKELADLAHLYHVRLQMLREEIDARFEKIFTDNNVSESDLAQVMKLSPLVKSLMLSGFKEADE